MGDLLVYCLVYCNKEFRFNLDSNEQTFHKMFAMCISVYFSQKNFEIMLVFRSAAVFIYSIGKFKECVLSAKQTAFHNCLFHLAPVY